MDSAHVVEELSKAEGPHSATIVLEAGTIEPLTAPEARRMAIQHAGKLGLSKAGISTEGGPYPIDGDGKTDDDLLMGKRGPVAAYRKDIKVAGM